MSSSKRYPFIGRLAKAVQRLPRSLLVIAALSSGQMVSAQGEVATHSGGAGVMEVPAAATAPSAEDAALPVVPVNVEADTNGDTVREQRRIGISIEEIIVTAQKREESINSVPIAVSAFTGDDLAALGANDLQTAARLIPGFNANENGGGSTIFTLRGVGFNDTTYTATGTVGIYIDEVSLPYSPMSRGPTVDIERLEVLKGPQGTLYGRNTTGGLINFIPNGPEASLAAGSTLSYSRFDTRDLEAFVTGPLTDSLRGRLAVRTIQSGEGWQYSNTRPDDRLGKQDKFSGRALLDWDATDALTFRLDLEGWYNHGDSQAPQAVAVQAQNPFVGAAALSPQVRFYPYQPDTDDPRLADWVDDGALGTKANDSFRLASIKSDWTIYDDLKLTAIGSIMRMESDGTAILTTGLDVYNVDTSLDARIDTQALEVRVSDLGYDGRFRWTAGANVSRDKAYENRFLYFDTVSLFFPIVALPNPLPPNLVSSHPVLNGEPTVKQGAIFVNTDTDITDTLRLTVGARYTKQNQRYYSCSYEDASSEGVGLNALFMGVSALTAAQYTLQTGKPGRLAVIGRGPGECFPINEDGGNDPVTAKLDESNVAGRIALGWQRTEDSLIYGSIGRGFKAGGFPVLNAAHTSQFEPVKQEQLLAFETGIKHTFSDYGVHTNFGSFYYLYKDKQLVTRYADPIFGPLPLLRNAPKSHVYGVELDIQANPVEGLFVALAASYIKTKVDEFISTNFTGDEEDFAGKPFNFSPEVQGTFVTDYSFPLTDRLNLGFGADVTYTGKTNGTLEQNANYDMDAYTLFGARTHLDANSGVWSLVLWGRNLTNELATTGSFNLGDTVVRYVGMPRTYGLTLTLHYD